MRVMRVGRLLRGALSLSLLHACTLASSSSAARDSPFRRNYQTTRAPMHIACARNAAPGFAFIRCFFPLSAAGMGQRSDFSRPKLPISPPFRPILSSSVPFPSFPPSPPLRATMAQKSDFSLLPPSAHFLEEEEEKETKIRGKIGGGGGGGPPVGREKRKEGNGGGGGKTLSSPFLYGETSPSISPLLFFSSRRQKGPTESGPSPPPFPTNGLVMWRVWHSLASYSSPSSSSSYYPLLTWLPPCSRLLGQRPKEDQKEKG